MSIPVEEGQIIEVNIEDLAHEGDGVARHDDYVIFVPKTAPGDQVRVRIQQCGPSYAIGHVLEVIQPVDTRVTPECQHYDNCGGCHLQHINRDEEIDTKRDWVVSTAERIADISNPSVSIVPSSGPEYGYRERSRFALESRGNTGIIGFRRRRSKDLVDISRCEIQNERNNRVLAKFREFLSRYGWEYSLWDIDEIMVRSAGEDTLLIFIAEDARVAPNPELAQIIIEYIPEVTGVIRKCSEEPPKRLAGKISLTFQFEGLDICSSATAFTQVNPFAASTLYSEVLRMGDLNEDDVVVELFSGVGVLTALIASQVQKVYAVDSDSTAVRDAEVNARSNGCDNVVNMCEYAADGLNKIMNDYHASAIVLDPPRSGCSSKLIEQLVNCPAEIIIYVSCETGTWARDARQLISGGWHLQNCSVIDMFPNTANTEIISLFKK